MDTRVEYTFELTGYVNTERILEKKKSKPIQTDFYLKFVL